MSKTYRIGFEDGHTCYMVQEYPDLIPIVRYSQFLSGELVAFAPCRSSAERLTQVLNMVDKLEKTWVADQ
jgi:hypothetical protein